MNKSLTIPELNSQLKSVKEKLFTGILEIKSEDGYSWKFSFRLGRINWQSGGINPSEKWQRYLKHFCYNLESKELATLLFVTEPNKKQKILNDLVEKRVISREELRSFIDSIIIEYFLDILIHNYNNKALNYTTIDNETLGSILHLVDPLNALVSSQKVFQPWRSANLRGYYPSSFPVIKQPDLCHSNNLNGIDKSILLSIDGRVNLYGLALKNQDNIVRITQLLLPLVKQGLIVFSSQKTTQNLNTSEAKIAIKPEDSSPKVTVNNQGQFLIACVDDSVLICQNLENIITKAGYTFLGIQDPFKALPLLFKNTPDLIFLDLIMPVTNGYELCSQLRKTPTFQDTPIVILTGKDGLIDRMRAKMVGSTDFMTKPIKKELVLEMIDKHIQVKR